MKKSISVSLIGGKNPILTGWKATVATPFVLLFVGLIFTTIGLALLSPFILLFLILT